MTSPPADSFRRAAATSPQSGVDYRGASYDSLGFDSQVSHVSVLEPASVVAGDRQQSRSLIVAAAARVHARRAHPRVVRRALAARSARQLPRRRAPDRRGRLHLAGPDRRSRRLRRARRWSSTRCPPSSRRASTTSSSSVSACAARSRRLGEAFASNLDRRRLLDVAVAAMCEGVAADAGRAWARTGADGELEVIVTSGDVAAAERVARRRRGSARSRTGPPPAGSSIIALRSRCRCAHRPARSPVSLRSPVAAARSARASATCSAISPSRLRSRSRTSTCTSSSSARRSRTA